MNVRFNKLQRLAYGVIALATFAAVGIPALTGSASAGSLSSRSIALSNSTPSATNVVYKVGVTASSGAIAIGGIAIDFCYDSPIIGLGTCSTPTGINTNKASLTVNNQTNISGLSVDTVNSTATKLILIRTAGAPAAANFSFELGDGSTNGFTNPSTVSTTSNQGTFYARIYTYTTTAAAQGHSTLAPSGYTDASGVAMSAATQISVTAKVQETLTFCVYTGANCTAGGGAVALGDANGVLSSTSTVYTNTSQFDLASNAASGAVVRLKGDTLKSGANSIAAYGAACAADSASNAVEQFGLRLSTVGAGQTAVAPYNCAAANHGLDVSTACAAATFDQNVTCTYGQKVATTAGPTTLSTSTVEYAAKSSTTTKPGIYTANLSYIATGTY